MNIDEIINQIYPLPPASALRLKQTIEEVKYPKGHILFEEGKTGRSVYFIKKGIVRAYLYQNNNEVTFWFGKEGDTVISMKSYVNNMPGYENIELLEDSILYRMQNKQLQKLFDEDIFIANWGRKFAETELVNAEERFISRQFIPAAERYETLISTNPALLQRVQLCHIASYLGITQVSLSRIRADVK